MNLPSVLNRNLSCCQGCWKKPTFYGETVFSFLCSVHWQPICTNWTTCISLKHSCCGERCAIPSKHTTRRLSQNLQWIFIVSKLHNMILPWILKDLTCGVYTTLVSFVTFNGIFCSGFLDSFDWMYLFFKWFECPLCVNFI